MQHGNAVPASRSEPVIPSPVHASFPTVSGHVFHYATPAHSVLTLEDIAHALSNLCRYGGHTRTFYSYAQHAVLVSRLVPPADRLAALLHDAPKAVLGNVQTALKPLLPDYRAMEERVLQAIHQRFGLPWPVPASIHAAALIVRATERRDLMPQHTAAWPELDGIQPLDQPILPMSPDTARRNFFARYRDLTPGREPHLALV